MPYFITDEAEDCGGWAVVTQEGEMIGCHLEKQAAIDQMVAVSRDEGIEPGGELPELEDETEMQSTKTVSGANYDLGMIRLSASPLLVQAEPGEGRREIMGLAAPYNVVATVSDGQKVKFLPGSLPVDGAKPKLVLNHDLTQMVGVVTERTEDENGLYFVAKLSKTGKGDEALELAKDGALDAVSVGAEPIIAEYDEEGVLVVEKARMVELSLVALGAFQEAKITQVAAAEPSKKGKPTMSEQTTTAEVTEAPAPAPTAPIWAEHKREREFPMPSAGEYLAAFHAGGQQWANVNAAYKQNVAKKSSAIEAAQNLTTDTPGLLPIPVLGPVFQDINYLRPFISAVGARAMPNGQGKSFIRPTISQHTTTGVQTEGQAAASQTMTIASNSVVRTTVAGQIFISAQDMDFTDPAAMQVILQDLAGQYLLKTDDIAVDACVSGSTNLGQWDGTPEDFIAFIYGAARDISNGSNLFPTHLVMGVDTWAKVGRLVDSDKRPIFPSIGATNLLGTNTLGAGDVTNWSATNPLGLRTIVDSNCAAKTMVVFHAPAMEVYENVRGIMSVEDPNLIGRTFSYYGYLATFVAKASLLQKITWV
jgi:HK97 family phage prohead protease